MADSLPIYSFLAEFLSSYGLMPRGGFRPEPQDGVPGEPVTVILIGNVGPGIGDVGPSSTYNSIPVGGKWFLALLMFIGRLELFTFLMIITPIFWRNN